MGSIPEVAGPNAFYIDENREVNDIKNIVVKASKYASNKRKVDVKRVENKFNPEIRESSLIKLINYL